jgi:ABC-type transport system involved in cytochrome bd biosynthesis fused ATPase/permease subunit
VKSTHLRLLLQRGGSRRLFIASILSAFIWVAIIVVSAIVLARVIVAIINRDSSAFSLILILAAMWSLRAVFQSTFEGWCSLQAVAIKQGIRTEVTSQLDSYSHVPPSVITTLLVKGLNSLDIYLGRFVPQLFFATVVPLVVIATLFILDPLSSLIAALTLPLIPLFGALIGRYTADSVSKKWRTLGSLSSYFEDSLRGFVTLKIFGRHATQSSRIEEMGDKYTRETMKVLTVSFLSALALELAATISVALIAVTIGIRLVNDSIDFTSALTVLILAPEVYFPVRNAASLFHASADGTQALEQLQEFQNKRQGAVQAVECDFSTVNQISWKQWGLTIPGRQLSVLGEHTVKRGEVHFILGESGAGKSTFALNLIGITHEANVELTTPQRTQFLTPELNDSWFKHLGWVPQLPQLAHGSVRDQFTLISKSAGDIEIEKILTRCGLEVRDLPQGLDSKVGGAGEGSNAASGGQIRKIAVARALFSQPQLLIADEPTADLDSSSSDLVMNALREYATTGAIVICITHDLSIVRPDDSRQSFETVVRS